MSRNTKLFTDLVVQDGISNNLMIHVEDFFSNLFFLLHSLHDNFVFCLRVTIITTKINDVLKYIYFSTPQRISL